MHRRPEPMSSEVGGGPDGVEMELRLLIAGGAPDGRHGREWVDRPLVAPLGRRGRPGNRVGMIGGRGGAVTGRRDKGCRRGRGSGLGRVIRSRISGSRSGLSGSFSRILNRSILNWIVASRRSRNQVQGLIVVLRKLRLVVGLRHNDRTGLARWHAPTTRTCCLLQREHVTNAQHDD